MFSRSFEGEEQTVNGAERDSEVREVLNVFMPASVSVSAIEALIASKSELSIVSAFASRGITLVS